MLLTEGFKNRIMELAGISADKNIISEADKRNVIVKSIKLPKELSKEIADWAHGLSDKYSVWIADSLQKMLVEIGFIDENGNVKNDPESPRAEFVYSTIIEDIKRYIKSLDGDYHHILDWLKGRNTLAPEHDQIDFKTLTFEIAEERSKEWHEKLKEIQGGQIQGEQGEIIKTFPDGFYWIKIGQNYCPEEAKAMGHCGRADGTTLYSLRRDKYPYVTAAVKENGVVTQMKGRANTKPKASLHKYIIPFIIGENPNVSYFNSSYAPETDFNINDLSDAELKQVVNKKPTLLMANGKLAVKRLDEQEIKKILIERPDIFKTFSQYLFPLSDILRNDDMVNWAMDNAPFLFGFEDFGKIKFSQEQLNKALSDEKISQYLYLDKLNLNPQTLNWVVINRPEMFENSIHTIEQLLNDEQKDYLVKNYPKVFNAFFKQTENDNSKSKKIFEVLGADRLKILFSNNPKLFSYNAIYAGFLNKFLSPELLNKYIKSHNEKNDPFNILTNHTRLQMLSSFFDINGALYILKHYPNSFYHSLISLVKKEGGEILGRYIVDHHFEWIEEFMGERFDTKFNIQDWNLSNNQKQKIVNSDAEGKTTILSNYNAEEIEKLNFSKEQIQELINSDEFNENLTIDLIKGFNLPPDSENTKNSILEIIRNEDDERKIINEITELYGAEYVDSLYKANPTIFTSLEFPIKLKEVKILKKYNSPSVSYVNEGIKIRFDDWSDEDLLDLFKDSREDGRNLAKQIANYELDFYGNDYKFSDINHNFDDLNPINIARVKFLIGKAFPEEFKDKIKSMISSDLVEILDDPDSISEETVDYDIDIIDAIKDAFVRATESSQSSADENEYWNLYAKPIKSLFGDSKFVDIKTQKKGEEVKVKQMLEFEISYEEFLNYIKIAENNANYFSDDENIKTVDFADNPVKIIMIALEENEDELEIDVPYNGVYGDIDKEELNELFGEKLFDDSILKEMLDKTKVVVKTKENES